MAVVTVGIAAAAAMLGVVLAGAVATQDRKIARAVEDLPAGVSAIRALSLGAPGQGQTYDSLDRAARQALRPVFDREPVATVLYREATIGGEFIGLGAVDGLRRWIRLRAGRLPRPCAPSRCEVVRIRGQGRIPNVPGLRLVAVGRAELATAALFGDAVPIGPEALYEASLAPAYQQASRYHRPAPPPVVLANGVRGLERSPVARGYRTYAWVVPIPPSVHVWAVDSLIERIERARSSVAASAPSFQLEAPVQALADARAATHVAGRRLLVLGGQAAGLLLAFAIFASAKLRRDIDAAWTRLRWSGATTWQLGALAATEAAGPALVGVAAGWALAAAGGAVLARMIGAPPGGVLTHSVASGAGVALAVALAVVATGLVAGAAALRRFRVAGVAVSPLDVAALGAVAVVAVAFARGQADADALLRERGTGALLLLFPALVGFAAAVGVARVVPLALRALERVTPRSWTSVRLAALSVVRQPAAAAAAVAFLVVAVGYALFAELYRATLERGQRDQAAFAAPVDFIVREDLGRLIPVAEAAPRDRLEELGRDVRAERVVRLEGSASSLTESTAATVLGLDAERIVALRGWRDDFSARPPASLGRLVASPPDVELRGFDLPPNATSLRFSATVEGRSVLLWLNVRTTRGTFVSIDLGRLVAGPPRVVSAAVPPEARGGRVVAFHLEPPRQTEERGGDAGGPARGTLTLGRLIAVADGSRTTVVDDYGEWIGMNGVELVRGARARIRYAVSSGLATYFRPRQPTDGRVPAVIASPRLAALADDAGRLPVNVAGERLVTRVVATARFFPGLSYDFVVADRRALVTTMNAQRPGAAVENEVWISVRSRARVDEVGRALREPPFDALEIRSYREIEDALESEPIARGSLAILGPAAVVALAVALLGIVLAVLADLRDEQGELFDLEAQGAAPSSLRRQLRVRALVVAVLGLAGGLGVGAGLSLLVIRLVAVAAGGEDPTPPLVVAVSWPTVAIALTAFTVAAAVAVVAVTVRSFRTATVARFGGDGA